MSIPDQPEGLGAGGAKLWAALVADAMPEHLVAMLTEACRVRDRLDALDDVIAKRGPLRVIESDWDDDPRHVIVTVDGAMQHAVSQASLLKNLLASIPLPTAKPAAKTGGGTPLDQLAERRNGATRPATTRARAAERRRPRK